MENQHRAISGYRELNAEEIALMNEIKATAMTLGDLVERMDKMNNAGSSVPAPVTVDKRWLSRAHAAPAGLHGAHALGREAHDVLMQA